MLRVLLVAGEPAPRTITASTLAAATGPLLAWLRLVSGRSELTACPTQFRIPHLERTARAGKHGHRLRGSSRARVAFDSGPVRVASPSPYKAVVDAQGNLHVPSGYRAAYEFLGTWAIAVDHGVGSSEIHNVYVTPGTIAAYHEGGHFPDGAVLIKEVYGRSGDARKRFRKMPVDTALLKQMT